ncbi:hypothetical protein E8E12_008147 [Didymella heteroderae]|uniref:WSC domain-containing protein n=1 Tax=Didymella heteroderae TaxID=1769908 RepID=A0A9P4WSC4_9PLEO|nr:hypothetical protein E8E12_008147 [Didymella heteroderae]
MKVAILTLLALTACAQAGNICVSSFHRVSRFSTQRLMIFAAGHPCEDENAKQTGVAAAEDYCGKLPVEVEICGAKMKYVKVDQGHETWPGCHVGLEYEGKVYEGKAGKGDCSAECGLNTIIDGNVLFENVPVCNL